MYRYETHLHTLPVSKCAKASVEENLKAYKEMGYAGVFITNHFLDGNIDVDRSLPYEEQIRFYFSDYEVGKEIGRQIGLQVLCGVELSFYGTDFLIYGLDESWFLSHPEIMDMQKSEELTLMREAGGLIIQAHPFREAYYIDHLRLYPRHVHGVETDNANRTAFENRMAEEYAKNYGLLPFAGSDNHLAGKQKNFAGLEFETPLRDEKDFVRRVKAGEITLFRRTEKEEE